MTEPIRRIIVRPNEDLVPSPDIHEDLIPPIDGAEISNNEEIINSNVVNLSKEENVNTIFDISALGLDTTEIVTIDLNNNQNNAINNLIQSIGSDKFYASHLCNLIENRSNIEDIKSNWLVLGTTDHEGNILLDKVELRKEEFELFIKQ